MKLIWKIFCSNLTQPAFSCWFTLAVNQFNTSCSEKNKLSHNTVSNDKYSVRGSAIAFWDNMKN